MSAEPSRQTAYTHLGLPAVRAEAASTFQVVIGDERPNCSDPLRHALATMRLAVELGALPPRGPVEGVLPYSSDSDNLVFDAPLSGLVCGRRMRLLRGWKQYGSCVKGFNGLGLLAEHAAREEARLSALPLSAVREEKRRFLASRTRDGRPVFSAAEAGALTAAELDGVTLAHLALWTAYGRRTIVCSTSSNMGISLHEALRYMQQKPRLAAGRAFTVLNEDEGELIIWCPDEQADFMNPEKTEKLRGLEAEKPRLTALHTYINRKQRDPGALKDALNSGGYFFPTNPQSREEMQNLLSISLLDVARERNVPFEDLLVDPNVRRTLDSLGCEIDGDRVIVRSGVVGGLYGLAVPYFIMLEETLLRGDARAVSTWNQASIGAALAAIVLCDMRLREGLPSGETGRELAALFPKLAGFLGTSRLERDILTRIHGAFDVANLQSLAQLFGVVVTKHMSGRGTAFVGLGSSSYANGNSCFDVLKASADSAGAFTGRDSLHPVTHSLNPISQALVFAEDMTRVRLTPSFAGLSADAKVRVVLAHSRKPEPAGAAAMTGYLLTRLDGGTLSVVELAYALRLAGFTKDSFLEFCGFGRDEQSANRYVQEATEEGAAMESLVKSFLDLMAWDFASLEPRAELERAHSRLEYRWRPLDDDRFEARNPAVHIYLTGDNCAQPGTALVSELLNEAESRGGRLAEALARDAEEREPGFDPIVATKVASSAVGGLLGRLQRGLTRGVDEGIRPLVNGLILEKARRHGKSR